MEKHDEDYDYGIVNRESFKEAYPRLYEAIKKDSFDEGFNAGQVKGRRDAFAETAHKQKDEKAAEVKNVVKKDESKMTIEEKAIKDWKSSAEIRNEFKYIGTYYAWLQNADKVKICGGVK